MPPKTAVTAEEDVKFLLTIIKLAGADTPDWQKVCDELDLPSKGAASKRYSRLPGKYNITMPSKGDREDASASPDAAETPKKAKPKKAAGSAKKRKVAEVEDDEEQDVKAESNE